MKIPSPATSQSTDGFTLVEMLVVLAILMLLASVAIPALRPPPDRIRLEAAGRTIAAALRLSRARAISTNDDVTFTLDTETRSFKVADAVTALDPQIGISMVVAAAHHLAEPRGAILFFPDGTSSGGDVNLSLGTRRTRISTNWLTGLTRLQYEDIAR